MTINELIEFFTDNFDEKQRNTMDVSIVKEYNFGNGIPEPIDRYDVRCGVRGPEIHVDGYE